MKYTLVEYAYPTSKTATKFGFGKIGCYTVITCPNETFDGWKDVAAYATKKEAEQHAETLDLPLHPCVKQATI